MPLLLLACLGSCLFSLVHSQAVELTAGWEHSCAILFDGSVKCWGAGGLIGAGDLNNRGDQPAEMGNNLVAIDLGAGRTAKHINAGPFHTCAILDDDTLKCWGEASSGRLGYGNQLARGDGPGEMGDNLQVVDLGTGRSAVQVSAGLLHTCAVLDDATLKCWGEGSFGRTGNGNTADRGKLPNEMGDNLPVVDLGTGRTALQVAAGDTHTCARLDDGSVKCWGLGLNGRLGYGDTISRGGGPDQMGDNLTAVDLGIGRTAVDISAASMHTCVVLDDATVKCWGVGSFGNLGYGDFSPRGDGPGEMGNSLPVVDLGSGLTALSVGAAMFISCAHLNNSTVKCWGEGGVGALGQEGTANIGTAPGQMGDNLPTVDLGTGQAIAQVAVGGDHVCVLLDDSTVKCWGFGIHGQLGYGDSNNRGDQPGSMGQNLPFVELLVTDSPTTSATASPTVQQGLVDPVLIIVIASAAGVLGLIALSALFVYRNHSKGNERNAKQLLA